MTAAITHRTRSHHVTGATSSQRTATARRGDVAHPTLTTLRRRRLGVSVAVALATAVLGLGVHGVLTGPGDVPASAAGTGTASTERAVRAEPGDSLWSIARRHRGEASMRHYVEALVDRNGGTTAIQAGQLVRLP